MDQQPFSHFGITNFASAPGGNRHRLSRARCLPLFLLRTLVFFPGMMMLGQSRQRKREKGGNGTPGKKLMQTARREGGEHDPPPSFQVCVRSFVVRQGRKERSFLPPAFHPLPLLSFLIFTSSLLPLSSTGGGGGFLVRIAPSAPYCYERIRVCPLRRL